MIPATLLYDSGRRFLDSCRHELRPPGAVEDFLISQFTGLSPNCLGNLSFQALLDWQI
jgi:hypothetical protein